MKYLLITCGYISVALGVLGIFLPLLPTTPLLLLAAYCFAKSSDKLYNKLLNNKYFGSYIKNYREKGGIKKIVKIKVISTLWLTISLSMIYAVESIWLSLILFVIASAVTYHIIKIKTIKDGEEDDKDRFSSSYEQTK